MTHIKTSFARYFYLLIFIFFLFPKSSFAQSSNVRYANPVFEATEVASSIVYGNNISLETGILDFQDLQMDVYQPSNDTARNRPLIILIHSGNFISRITNKSPNGTRKDSTVVELSTRWAQRGFVVASISHRLGWATLGTPEEARQSFTEAMYRAVQDANTCVRYFKKQYVEDGNLYGIDTSKIVVGGLGSGAYTALGAAYLDDPKELEIPKLTSDAGFPYINDFFLGDFEGKDSAVLSRPNLPNYSSNFDLAFSVGGAIVDTNWIEPGDIPLVALHTPNDPRIPYETATIRVPFFNNTLLEMHGGYAVSSRSFNMQNQAIFLDPPLTDDYTMVANNRNRGYEGLFPLLRPEPEPGEIFDCEISSGETLVRVAEHNPWNWWNEEQFISDWDRLLPNDVLSGAVANCNELAANPDMSGEKGRLYADTIIQYITPRIIRVFGLPTSIENKILSDSQISIYPNPTKHFFVVETANSRNNIEDISIFNMQGQLVWHNKEFRSPRVSVQDISLHKGIYLVKIKTNQGLISQKISIE